MNSTDAANLLAFINAGQFEKAEAAARRWTKKTPDEHLAHFFLGVAQAQLNKFAPAAYSFRKSLSLNARHFESLNNLAAVLEELREHDEAIELYQRALHLQSGDAGIFRKLGVLYRTLQRGDDALAAFSQAAALEPTHAQTHNSIAELLIAQSKPREAIAAYQRSLAADAHQAGLMSDIGALYGDLGEHTEALIWHRRAVAKDEGLIRSWANLARAEKALNLSNTTTLERILAMTLTDRAATAVKMWAALQLNRPESAFALTSDKFNILPYAAFSTLENSLAAHLAALPPTEGNLPPPSGGPVIFAGASGDYAEIFFEDLVSSALAKSPYAHIHLHLINPGRYKPETELKRFTGGRATWTTESVPTPDRTLYSTRRFIRLLEIASQTNRTFFAIDADTILNGDIAKAVEGLQPFDVLIYDRPDQIFANQMVNASFLAFAPTEGARAFLAFVAAYILHFESKGEAKWFIDQLAILAAKIWFAKTRSEIAVKSAPPHMLDWAHSHAPESVLWTAKGRSKDKAVGG